MATKKPVKKSAKNKVEEKNKIETTGHEWDGIKEYNTPLPRWWLWVFFACILYSIGYVIYYPAIPTPSGATKGISGWSQYKELEESKKEDKLNKKSFEDKIEKLSIKEIMQDENLYDYAIAAGKTQFALDCSQCHGSDANGGKGFPSLIDDEWLYGGSIEDILTTITHGIRYTEDEETRDMGPMLSFGKDEILTKREINDVISYLYTLSGKYQSGENSERGQTIFEENCIACHGEDGKGNQEIGAPNLANQIWLYGGDRKTIFETIFNGRSGVMPSFSLKHNPATLKKLAIYVHSLTGGEE